MSALARGRTGDDCSTEQEQPAPFCGAMSGHGAAGWGAYLVGKPYTPATTVTHPAHFDFVPTATMPSSMATSVRSTAAAAPAAPKRKGIDDSLHAKRAKAGNDTANYLHTTDAMCCE